MVRMEDHLSKEKYETLTPLQKAFVDSIVPLGNSDCSKKDLEHFISMCKTVTNAELLCGIIRKLLKLVPYAPFYYGCKGKCFLEMLPALVETLMDLLNSETYNKIEPVQIESMDTVVLMLFDANHSLSPEILTKVISNRYVFQEPITLESILCGLIKKDRYAKVGLKSNDNFCTLLRHFGVAADENRITQTPAYRMIIQFLINNHDWILAKELLPSVLNISHCRCQETYQGKDMILRIRPNKRYIQTNG